MYGLIVKEMSRYGRVKACMMCKRPCLYAWYGWNPKTPMKYALGGSYSAVWLLYLYSDGTRVPDEELKKRKIKWQDTIMICKLCEKQHFYYVLDSKTGDDMAIPKTDEGKKIDGLRIIKYSIDHSDSL